MSVWLTPELQPFFGGTYFPPENRYGHPGFASTLTQVAEAWRDDRDQILESARGVVKQLERHVAVEAARPGAPGVDNRVLESGFFAFRRGFDTQLGGFGGAPKFPRPSVFNFLLRYHARTGNREALDMTLLTLREMAKGGMNDQLGGGFHRYSVDERWFVPHFEKMLYDQAQLAASYIEAYQITGDAAYADVARRTLDYVLRDMTGAAGGFYSAEDADSVIVPEEPGLKGEGAFYIWAAGEIRALVPALQAEWFCYRYGVAGEGNVVNDPHGEFTGKNILYQAMTVEETAREFAKPVEEIRAGIEQAERILLEARAQRVRPLRDDKILTSWNGLTISALARAGAVLNEPRYAQAARRAAEFAMAHLHIPETGVLLRRYCQGEAAIPAFLDDYALFAQALLDLYETQFDLRHLEMAVRLTEKQQALFEDRRHGGFFSSADGESDLVLRVKEAYDGAEPSGNSVAVLNLLRLAQITNRAEFRQSAERTLAAFGPSLESVPAALPQMLAACEFFLAEPRQVVIVGEKESADTLLLLRQVFSRFAPNRVVLLVDEGSRGVLEKGIPAVASMHRIEGRASAYVCRDYACQLPVSEPEALAKLIQ